MSKQRVSRPLRRRILIGAAITAATVVTVGAALVWYFNPERQKASIEAAVSKTLGHPFTIRGKASLRLLPRVRLILRDIHLTDGTIELFSAAAFSGSPRVIPFLLGGPVTFHQARLEHPTMRFERAGLPLPAADTMREAAAEPAQPRGALEALFVRQAEITYVGGPAGAVTIEGADFDLEHVSWASRGDDPSAIVGSLSFRGLLAVKTLRLGTLDITGLTSRLTADSGLVQLDSTVMTLYGGETRGKATLDMRGKSPRIHVVQSAPKLDLALAFPVAIARGFAGASLDLEGTGANQLEFATTAKGSISIRSAQVAITALDIDGLIHDYNKSQNFSIIDFGSLFFAGPFAPLVTRGATLAQLRFLGNMGKGKGEIRRMVSDWKVENGFARTVDVAFATPENMVAFRGNIDLRKGTFDDFAVATIDHRGCAQVRQKITGLVGHPDAQGPVSSFIGPFKSLFKKVTKVFEPNRCDHFYSGSVLKPAVPE